jgi:hypothetical protein
MRVRVLFLTTTEAQEFLFKSGDDCAVVGHRNEEDEEMPGTNIPWPVIGEAMRVDELLQRRRSARMRDLFQQEEFDSKEEEFEEDTSWRKIEGGGEPGHHVLFAYF